MIRLPRLKGDQLVVIGCLTTLFAVSLLLAQRPQTLGYDPKNARQGSSQYPSPFGGKAYFTLLERLGRNPVRHGRSFEFLPAEAKVLMLLGPSEALVEEEARGLRDWVTRGGTLVLSPRRGESTPPVDPVLRAFGLSLTEVPDPKPSATTATLAPLDPRESRVYKLSLRHGLRLQPGEAGKPPVLLAEDAMGGVAGVAPRGQGRLIVLTDPDLYSNEGISRADHVEFMVRLADLASGGAPILFDEFHHGFKEDQSAFSILWASPSMQPVLILLMLAIFCGVIATGRRLGPAVDFHPERRRRPGEFIDAFAGLCRKLKTGPQALAMVLSEFRLHLQQAHGAASPEAYERLGARAGLEPGALSGALDRATRVSKSPLVDEGALVDCCRELESLRNSLRKNSPLRTRP